MNTERLLEVALAIRDELESSNRVYELFDQLVKGLQQNDSSAVNLIKNNIFAVLGKAPSNRFTPSRQAILREIGGEKLVGKGLSDRLTALLEDYRLSPKEAAKVVAAINGEILNFNGFINTFTNSSRSLHLEPNTIPAGHCEIGVLYPKPEVIGDLDSLVEESRRLDQALRTFAEIGGKPASPKIKQISSSNIGFYLSVAASAGLIVAKCIDKILGFIYKKYEIEKIRLEIEEKKISLDVAKNLKEQEKAIEEAGIKETAGIILDFYKGTDEGRKNELRIAATDAIRFMVIQIHRGVIFEVEASNRTSKGTEIDKTRDENNDLQSEASQLKEVRRLGGSMRELAAKREQLALPEAAMSNSKRAPKP